MTTPKALFVDDEPYVLKSLKRIFLDEDIEIAFAENGEEALEYLRQNPVDLILSDHNMPGMSGVELLKRCREMQPDTIRMLITGKGDMEIAMQAINQGNIYKFFSKPWEDEDVRISVKRALEFKKTQEEMQEQKAQLARYEAYRQTMVTVSHYINNFNCALTMSLDSLKNSPNLTEAERGMLETSFKASRKISEVLRILNRLQELKIVEQEYSMGMIDIEREMEEATHKIEELEV